MKIIIRNIYWSLLLFLVTSRLEAQLCDGTLGDNIFTDGDFGTGFSNLFSPDPNIAPGYNYTFNTPPADGEYVLTNNTSVWTGLYPSWLEIRDNSDDIFGYMMVVNASFSPGLFYEQNITGLCENTLYEFTADIINLIKAGTPDHIDPNVSFLLDGVEFFSTNNIPKTEEWNTYGFTFTTDIGQESLTLSLRNNAPGGNGNDLALDNISFRACGPVTMLAPEGNPLLTCEDPVTPVVMEAIIIGDQLMSPALQWQQSFDQGLSWEDIPDATENVYVHTTSMPGYYYYRYIVADGTNNLSSNKCRANSDFKIIRVLPKETMRVDTICSGEILTVGESSYTEMGIYMDTLSNVLGCDSIVTTDLSIENSPLVPDILVTPSCANEATGSIEILDVLGGTPPYTYSLDGMGQGSLNFFDNLAGDQFYTLEIDDGFNCPLIVTVFVENYDLPNLDLGEDLKIELGDMVNLTPIYDFTPIDYNWDSTSPIDCNDLANCLDIDFLPLTSQWVTLTLFDDNNCPVLDSIFIEVLEVRKVTFPNIFSPNGDNINDFFSIYGDPNNVLLIEDLQIFDRWGSLVFEGTNLLPNEMESGWNGRVNGRSAAIGLYAYSANIRFLDNKVLNYSGDVLLVK